MKSGIFAYLCMCVFVCLCIWSFVKLFILCCNVFAVHATFGPLLLGGSRQWNQEVLCLPSLPLCLSALPLVQPQCKAVETRNAVLQREKCRENGPTQSLPPPPPTIVGGLFCQSLT